MSDSALMDMNLRDLDLNQEPMNPHLRRPVPTFETLLNELDTAQELIEQRIRQLEGVSAHERQPQGRNSIETNHFSSETSVDMDSNGGNMNESHLVEKALEINSSVEKPADKGSGSFYDCNICLDMARDPVLTCCGHLFCWPCFYQVSNVYSSSKECPVCKGEVSESTVIPIYGNGGCDRVCETESGLKIPPRPKARRVESVRQLCVTRNLSNVPVDEAIQRIRVSISAMGHYHEQQEENGDGIHRVSRVLSESAASLSSLSSALNSAERLIEDLENVISARNDMRASSVGGNLTGLQSNDQPLGLALTSDSNVVLPFDSSIQSTGVSGSDVHTLRRRASYSLRRRSVISRASDVEGQRQSRRRRLN